MDRITRAQLEYQLSRVVSELPAAKAWRLHKAFTGWEVIEPGPGGSMHPVLCDRIHTARELYLVLYGIANAVHCARA